MRRADLTEASIIPLRKYLLTLWELEPKAALGTARKLVRVVVSISKSKDAMTLPRCVNCRQVSQTQSLVALYKPITTP